MKSNEKLDLSTLGILVADIVRNPSPAAIYEDAARMNDGQFVASGALAANSGEKTGRCPKDKRIVDDAESRDEIWWGPVNIPMDLPAFMANRQRAIEFLNQQPRLYAIDGFGGWDPKHRIKIRVLCARPYHALFMHNMLIRPSAEELASFGEPDYVIFNAGQCLADPKIDGNTSTTSVDLSFERGEMVILGTEYAGEMKKGVFTIMHRLMPKHGVLSMHCSANEGDAGDVSLFFGLSGTGKTTLSADPRRDLIGDDEHCWTESGVFNIEGGCYAKCINLSHESEPEIFDAIRFGSVLENVAVDPRSRSVDFSDVSATENIRVSYPIEFIPHAKIPCIAGHPRNVILLTCDAFGVLPPVSRLSPEQLMYHFVSGYTAKVAGTEQGVTEPEATFSACFGAAFLVWHPTKYAELLAQQIRKHAAKAWLINTGWAGGAYGSGKRIKLEYTRAIIDALHAGQLDAAPTRTGTVFGLDMVTRCPGVPDEILVPKDAWTDTDAFFASARKLAALFNKNFAQYADAASKAVREAGPVMTEKAVV